MEVESQSQPGSGSITNKDDEKMSKSVRRALIILNYTIMVIGTAGGPLLLRLYFLRGGNRKWLSSFIQSGGFPLIFLPLSLSYLHRRRRRHRQQPTANTKPYLITPRILLSCAAIGLLVGIDNYMYAYGLSYLPVSTSSILVSSQLGFTAFFAFLLVRQRFTAFSVNSIALLSFGAVMLGLDGNKDRLEGVSREQYYMAFFLTLAAALLYGALLPTVELIYARAEQAITYTLVMEMQLAMGFFSTAFCTVGMIANKDFQVIPREAKEFELGEFKYYMVLVCTAISFQFFFLGTVGAIFYGSALLAGVILAVLLPVTEVLAVFFFHEPFSGEKGLSLALSLWGLVSYFYGEHKENKRKRTMAEVDSTLNNTQN